MAGQVCHLLGCCQAHVAATVWRFDYAGIVVLIVTSFVPPVYYGFMCNPGLRAFYLISTTCLGAHPALFPSTLWVVLHAGLPACIGSPLGICCSRALQVGVDDNADLRPASSTNVVC
jgi:hypothetical protein